MKNKLLKTLVIGLALSTLVACGGISDNTSLKDRTEKTEKSLETESNENSSETEKNEESENSEESENNDDSNSKENKKKDSKNKNKKGKNKKDKKKDAAKKKKREVIRKTNKQTENGEDIYRIRATIKEKNNDSLVIVDRNGSSYNISFEETPNGYDDANVEDKVQIDFTGELSEADGLKGNIINIISRRKK